MGALRVTRHTSIRYSSLLQWSMPLGKNNWNSEEYRCTHVDACVARTLISCRCVSCHLWCTHRTSLVVKKKNFSFPVAVKSSINPLTPNSHYSGRTAPLTSRSWILNIYSTNIHFKHAAHSPFFSSSKCRLFHNAALFCSYIIHILNTECANI
jgi:hypothetical protein